MKIDVLSESDLEKLAEARLSTAGVMNFVDRDRSQFLEVSPGWFCEIVLTDATKQADAERVIRELAGELRTTQTPLEYVVRSLWRVGKIRYAGPARTPEGGLRTALDFRAGLQSGKREIEIEVDVTIAALTVLRQKLGKDEWVMHIGWSPDKGDVQTENISAAIAVYLDILLSHGGTSYWDPLLHDRLDLDETAMSYVLGHSAAFQELHTAITDAFSEPVVKSFLQSLSVSSIRLRDFDRALSDLSTMLGGAFRRGQRFSVSASELYENLTAGERQLVKDYYLISARKLKNQHPEFVAQFPHLFDRLE